MIRAAIDPGSRWIAVTITRDDPASPCTFLDALPIKVGQWVPFGPRDPKYRKPKIVNDVEVYTPLGEHVATQDDRDVAADTLAAFLVRWGVEAVDIETVDRIYAATPQAASEASKHMLAARETVSVAVTLWRAERTSRGLDSPRVPILASTWRARLVPMIKALLVRAGKPIKGVLIRGKGAALEPVLVEHVPGWPGGARWSADEVEHIRDSTGLALACGLPALPSRTKASSGPRVRKPRGASKASPRGSRARGKMAADKLAKARATTRAYQIRTFEGPRREARAAAGCVCKAPGAPGRHKATCPMHKPRRPVPQG